MKQAIQGIVILSAFLLMGCGPRYVKTPTPEPTPVPTAPPAVQYDPAALVDAVIEGLDLLQVDKVVESAAGAQVADTHTAHTSDWGQFVQDIAPLLPYLAFIIVVVCGVIIALAVLWFLVRSGDSRNLGQLVAALARLEALFKSAGVEVESE